LTRTENDEVLLNLCKKIRTSLVPKNTEIVKGATVKSAGYTLYEVVNAPEDIWFVIDIVKDLGLISLVAERIITALYKYGRAKMKTNGKETTITIEDIRKAIQEELSKKNNEKNADES